MNSTISFQGGTIFCDAASGYLSIYHQQSFTAHETTQSLLGFEREGAEVGINIQGYQTDNGVYTAQNLTRKLQENHQILRLSGVGAHHQNGVAEMLSRTFLRKLEFLCSMQL